MKRTVIVTLDYTPDTGGVAVFWSNIFKFLPKKKCEIIAPTRQDARPENGVARLDFFYTFLWPRWVKLFFSVKKYCKQSNTRHLLAAQVLPIGTVAFFLKKFGCIDTYQVACYGMDLAQLQGRKKYLAKRILLRAEKVMANSELTKNIIKAFGVRDEKIYIVYPCPNILPDSDLDIRKKYQLADTSVLLSVGRLVERKGIDIMIKALPRIWEQHPESAYVIVGDGPDRARLEQLVADVIPPEKQQQIICTGKVADEVLSAYYRAADIFVLPTRTTGGDTEGFGIVNLEAGLFSLPVVAGEVSGKTRSVIHDKTGLLVHPESARAVAQAIIQLLGDTELRHAMGNSGKKYANQFDWQQEAKKIIKNF